MFNIAYKGKFEDEKQLIDGEQLDENAVQYNEGKNINDLFEQGFVLIMPIMIVVMLATIVRLNGLNGSFKLNPRTILIISIGIIVYFFLKLVHECIHAILYPRKSKKTIWKYGSNGAFFTYCSAQVSKTRFIIISLAPMVVLGIIPFIIWLFVADKIDFTASVVYVVLTWIMILFTMGDVANVFNTIKQVPKKGKVFTYGMHSYWIK